MMRFISRLLTFLCLLAASCGVEVGNPKNPGESAEDPPKNVVVDDQDAAFELIAASVDEAVQALSSTETGRSSEASLALAGDLSDIEEIASVLANQNSIERSLVCDDSEDDKVTVDFDFRGTLSYRRLTRAGLVQVVTDVNHTQDKTFSGEGSFIGCANSKKAVRLRFRELNELKLVTSFTRSNDLAITRVRTGALIQNVKKTAKGSRTFTWKRVDGSSSEVASVAGTLEKSVERTLNFTTPANGDLELSSSLKTTEDEPLEIISDYSRADGALVRKTITTGRQESVQQDGSKVTASYSDVVILRETGCQPQSGRITGEIFNSQDDEEAAGSYTVDFSSDGAVLTFSTGETLNYTTDTCGFDLPE